MGHVKVAMIADHGNPLDSTNAGGQRVHVAELSAGLSRCGHEVTVYTRRSDPGATETVHAEAGFDVVFVPAGPAAPLGPDESLPYIGDFTRFLDDRWLMDRPDVVHAHYWTSGVAAQLAANRHGLPTVQTFHGLGDTDPPERAKLEALVAKGATWVAAACSDEVFELIRMGRARSRISVVPSGVDLDQFSPVGPAAEHGLRHRIVAVGKLLPHNGFDTLIAAIPGIADTELVIVGGPNPAHLADDPNARRLRKVAAQHRVSDRVSLLGSVSRERMPEMLRSADLVTHVPWFESFGTVVLEAMACGVPVLASAVGGMLDTVVDGVTGRFVSPRQPTEVSDVANEILRGGFFARAMGASGRDRARSRYCWDRVVADVERIYARVGVHGFDDDERAVRSR